MKGAAELSMAIRAGYSLFYAQTYEMNRCIATITETINGLIGKSSITELKVWDVDTNNDPMLVTEWLESEPCGTVVLAKNWNWFLRDEYGNPNKVATQFLQNRTEKFSSTNERKILIIASDASIDKAIPDSLAKDFLSIDFELPNETEITALLDSIIKAEKSNKKFVVPTDEEKQNLVNSSKGLTKHEIENAYSYSLVQHAGKLESKTIAGIRARNIENTAGIKLSSSTLTFDNLKGYDNLKSFTKRTLKSPLSKGIILLGPPGTGKTCFCQCLGNESGLPLFEMEIAELFGGLVGDSEKLMKKAIEIIIANAPCIVLIDEIEKALAGVGGSQSGDGRTTQRSTAQLLKFLSNPREGIYVVATCNDMSKMPPEWGRIGRWDSAPFFIDLPSSDEKEAILKYYQAKYNVNSKPEMEGWSGAEIEGCCRIASMMGCDTKEASRFIVPVSKTMDTEIATLRDWAKKRTVPATVFQMVEPKAPTGKKAINY